MLDRSIGILGLALTIIAWLSPSVWPMIPTIIAQVGVYIGILFIVIAIFLLIKTHTREKKVSNNVPNKTIAIVNSDTGYQNYWHIGSQDGKPILQLVCNFIVSNIIDQPISLANAILNGINGEQAFAIISVKDVNSKYSGSYEIPPKRQTSVLICFIIHPKKMPKSGASINLKVGIIDQFANKYWVKDVAFRNT